MEALKASLAARGGRKGAVEGGRRREPAKPERKPATRADARRGEARAQPCAVGNGKKGPGREAQGPDGVSDAACEGLLRARRRRDARGALSRA